MEKEKVDNLGAIVEDAKLRRSKNEKESSTIVYHIDSYYRKGQDNGDGKDKIS